MLDEIKKKVEEIKKDLVKWRRDFHRYPEIAFQEKRTSAEIRKFLEGLGLPVKGYGQTGLRADLHGKPGGPTVALRADMDALPIQEEGDKEYISLNPGAAHACAHDGHMATVMGAAYILSQLKERFSGRVVFIFQPSEELPPGGALEMIEAGVLEGVDAIFGLHFWQAMPTGTIGIVKGPMMAQADNFEITVKGKAGHGSMPHQTIDSILAASQVVVNIQSIVSRNNDPLKPLVVSFGTVKGGTVYNIIPDEVRMTGTVRTFDSAIQTLARDRLEKITEETCRTFGAESNFLYLEGYPPLVNPPDMVDFALEAAANTLGKKRIITIDPVMGGEDFAYYLQKIPGTFLFFGMGDGMDFPHHHPAFDMDEKALPEATLLMINLALDYLSRSDPQI